jgi:hypothetical protein
MRLLPLWTHSITSRPLGVRAEGGREEGAGSAAGPRTLAAATAWPLPAFSIAMAGPVWTHRRPRGRWRAQGAEIRRRALTWEADFGLVLGLLEEVCLVPYIAACLELHHGLAGHAAARDACVYVLSWLLACAAGQAAAHGAGCAPPLALAAAAAFVAAALGVLVSGALVIVCGVEIEGGGADGHQVHHQPGAQPRCGRHALQGPPEARAAGMREAAAHSTARLPDLNYCPTKSHLSWRPPPLPHRRRPHPLQTSRCCRWRHPPRSSPGRLRPAPHPRVCVGRMAAVHRAPKHAACAYINPAALGVRSHGEGPPACGAAVFSHVPAHDNRYMLPNAAAFKRGRSGHRRHRPRMRLTSELARSEASLLSSLVPPIPQCTRLCAAPVRRPYSWPRRPPRPPRPAVAAYEIQAAAWAGAFGRRPAFWIRAKSANQSASRGSLAFLRPPETAYDGVDCTQSSRMGLRSLVVKINMLLNHSTLMIGRGGPCDFDQQPWHAGERQAPSSCTCRLHQ